MSVCLQFVVLPPSGQTYIDAGYPPLQTTAMKLYGVELVSPELLYDCKSCIVLYYRNVRKLFPSFLWLTDTESGHIPGSISLPFHSLLAPSGHFLPLEQLQALFAQAGVDLSRPMCVSCGSAVTACHVALAAEECGHSGASIYDGGWSEWYARAVPEHVISEGRGKYYWCDICLMTWTIWPFKRRLTSLPQYVKYVFS